MYTLRSLPVFFRSLDLREEIKILLGHRREMRDSQGRKIGSIYLIKEIGSIRY